VTALCWLHPDDADVHDVDLLEGWLLDDGEVIPAALRCARAKGPGQDWRRRPATAITVEAVRS
jgi:hypothetical protein